VATGVLQYLIQALQFVGKSTPPEYWHQAGFKKSMLEASLVLMLGRPAVMIQAL
jgi:hypothetical protein